MSKSEHGPVMPLEQRRIASGRYLIEGWDVDRRGSGSHVRWGARRDGSLFTRRTLREIKEEIHERLENESSVPGSVN